MLNKFLRNFKILKKYVNHNYFFFPKKKPGNQIFLVEFNGWQGIHIAFSYIVNFFSKNRKCKIIAFESHNLLSNTRATFLEKIKWDIGKLLKIKTFGVYSSFGASDFIKPKYDDYIKKNSSKNFKHFFKTKKNLIDLESLRIENIWIGDLIYDSYLKKYATHTIKLNSKTFKSFFFECLCNFYFWYEYFKKQKITGIAVAHSVYISAIPSRIADYKNILNFSFDGANFVNGTNKISYIKRENNSVI
jgi:hypothetical protein